MSKHLIIEIGTNSIKCLKANYIDGSWSNLSDAVYPSRIGENLSKTGKISPEAMERNLKVIIDILAETSAQGHYSLHIIATESLRLAANADEFVQKVFDLTGQKVEILSGDAEAELSFLGVTSEKTDFEDNLAVIDIGGGSTELTIGQGKNILSTQSIPIGAVRLTEFCIRHDPISAEELNIITSLIDANLSKYKITKPITKLIGVGGTITTLAALHYNQAGADNTKLDGLVLTRGEIKTLINFLINMSLRKKQMLPNMPKGRADIILAGALILENLMLKTGLKEITVSIRGVRHGYLFTRIS
jgi:exopolyphosphatase/guanosine-5'-triphosphate,3'-diphosphate pyrophosphatase